MRTRRTSRRKPTRTSRSLRSNARPIKIDRALADELMGFIRQSVKEFKSLLKKKGEGLVWTEEQMRDWSGSRLSAQKVFRLKDVSGDEKNYILNIRVQDLKRAAIGSFENRGSVKSRMRYPGTSKDARKARIKARNDLRKLIDSKASGFVDIYLIPRKFTEDGQTKYDWRRVNSSGSLRMLDETLIHELVHASEKTVAHTTAPFPRYDEWMKHSYEKPLSRLQRQSLRMPAEVENAFLALEKADDNRLKADLEDALKSWYEKQAGYRNRYIELRAFMTNILSEIRWEVMVSISRLSYGDALTPRAVTNVIQNALAASPTWAESELILGRKGRNILLKGIVTALEDEGIITIE